MNSNDTFSPSSENLTTAKDGNFSVKPLEN